jgi:thioredoxin:protein disulfide reductase
MAENMGNCEGRKGRVGRRGMSAKRAGLALAVAATALAVRADDRPPQVQAHMVLATDAVHAGSKVKIAVVAEIPSGFHINDHKPTLEYLIPTEIKLTASNPLSIQGIFYPRGEPRKFTFEDTPLSVYEGTVVIGALLEVSSSAAPGEYSLQGKFSYQACNTQACFPPSSVPITLNVKVVGKKVRPKTVNQDVFRRASFK